MSTTIEIRSPDHHRAVKSRMPIRRKEQGSAEESGEPSKAAPKPEPEPARSSARMPGAAVQLDSDTLAWIQSS